MPLFRTTAVALALFCAASNALAQASYSTGFEPPEFILGDVNGQNGWGHGNNSFTGGAIELVPAGSPAELGAQSLAVRTRNVGNEGVRNHLYSATIDPPAGENGSVRGGVAVPNPQPVFQASFWYHTPLSPLTSTLPNGRFAELNPSSKGTAVGDVANRYAQVRLYNTTNTGEGLVGVEMRWFTSTTTAEAQLGTLNWNEWYRFEYLIHLVDGTDGAEPNDRFTLIIFDSAGNQIGTACGSTWELGYRDGGFGGGPGARAVNGFDFFSLTRPNTTLVGYIDNFSMSTGPAFGPVTVGTSGETNVCSGGTTTLTASASGGTGMITSYVWTDASSAVVGNTATLIAGAGTYTVTATDTLCVTGTNTITVTSEDPLLASITGTTGVCFGGTTTLTANASGGSGSITAYEWRDASSAIVGTDSTLTAGAGTYTVTVTDAACGTATSSPVEVQTVCKATPVVTWSNPADIVYGTPLSTTQLNATANVPGTFTYTPPAGTVLNAGANQILTVDFVPADTANYNNVDDTTVQINVLPATPVVSWSTSANITYGTPLGAAQLNATANVAGTFTYDPPAGTVLNAGANQTLSVDFTPADTTNYNNVTGTTVMITVDKAPTTLTITDVFPSPSTQGEPVTVYFTLGGTFGTPSGTVTVTDGVDSCTAAATASACTMILTTAGPRTITASYSGDANHFGSAARGVSHRVDLGLPTARVDGSTSICEGESASIRVRLTGVAPWTITWSDGVVETVDAATHRGTVAPRETTSYAIVEVRDRNGVGHDTGIAVVTVIVVAAPQIIETPVAELGKPVTLRATPGYTSYQWFRNGQPIGGESSSELTIEAVSQADLASYTVSGRRDGCLSGPSVPYTLVLLALPSADAVIPVVGTVHGIGGSLFRTTVHLSNGTEDVMEGEITFIDEHLPPYRYTLVPGETRFIEDLLPPSFAGLTSANVRRLIGPLPVVVAHVFNDEGEGVTSGMIERAIPIEDIFTAGDRAVLVTPIDPTTTRFNLGMRSLSEGMALRVVRRDAAGQRQESFERELPPSTLVHEPLTAGSSESLTFEIVSGSGVIYGAATDNGTNDPNMQPATKLSPRTENGRYVLPVAGSGRGNFNSLFATALQVHNPGDEPLTATIWFIPAGLQHTIVVEPQATLAIEDVVAAMGTTGFGSLELITSADVRPVVLARIYSIAAEGQTSFMTYLVPIEDVLVAGDEALIIAPHAPEDSRFNIGMRTFDEGAQLTATVRNPAGAITDVIALQIPAETFMQEGAPALLGRVFVGDESVTFRVDRGSAVTYGVWTNNVTQDPALQYAVRP